MTYSDIVAVLALGGVAYLLWERRRLKPMPPLRVRDRLDEAIQCCTDGAKGRPWPRSRGAMQYDGHADRHPDPYWWATWLSQNASIADEEMRLLIRQLTENLSGNGNRDPWPDTPEEWQRLLSLARRARHRWDDLDSTRAGHHPMPGW